MSGNAPVDPAEIPVFTGDLAALDGQVKALAGHGTKVVDAADDVHTSFGGLSAFYRAPEAEQLFATTQPVTATAGRISSDTCVLAGALGTYANEVRPLIARFEVLRAEAVSFREQIKDDDKWREDGDLIDENLGRRNEVAEVWARFQEAERTAHATIVALVGGKPLRLNDGSNAADMYGYDAEAMKASKSLPWGDAVAESTPWWQVWEHAADFVTGFVIDGVWATAKGLSVLVGFEGLDAAGQAWKGLAQLATGVVVTVVAGPSFWTAKDEDLPSWLRDSRTAMKETGKALVAWDQWDTNPSRAAGAVTFNVVTTIFTGGAGAGVAGAGKAGASAKVLSALGKTGRAVDPTTYLFKGVGAGFSKAGEVMAGLRNLGRIEIPRISDGAYSVPEGTLRLPDGTLRLPEGADLPPGATRTPEGTVRLPEGTVVLPPGTAKLPFEDGPVRYIDQDGNLYKEDGTLHQRATDAPSETAPTTTTPSPLREPALVGASVRTADDPIRLGSDLGDPVVPNLSATLGDGVNGTPGGVADHLPGGTVNNPPLASLGDNVSGGAADNVPSNTVDNTGTGSRGGTSDGAPGGGGAVNSTPDTTPAGGGGSTADDVTSGGGRGGDGSPGGSGGDDGPPNPLERPSYMRDGKNPYGPPGSLTLEQIERIQVYRANTEPGYFEEFYKKNGDRRLLSRTDASELAPPQLTRSGPNEPWVRAKDAPDPPPPSYLEPDYISRGRDTVTDQKRLEGLDEAARKRYMAIEFDNIVKYYKDAAGEVHGVVKSEESAALLKDGEILYKESHTAMGKEAGQFGEYVAEHHYIPENHPGAVKETLHGPKNGNHQFDQVWRLPDGKYVVVEAKSSVDTRLGARNLPDGRRVSQGTREYFEDIIRVMRRRGKDIDSERLLADALEDALARGNLEYAVVKGEPKSPQYTGYRYQRFDISKRSLP